MGNRQSKLFCFSLYIFFFAILVQSFCLLHLHPHVLAPTLSAGLLSRLQRAQGFGFTGYVVMAMAALQDPPHIIGFHPIRTGPKIAS